MKAVLPYKWFIISCFLLVPADLYTQKDSSFFSQAFNTERWYRIYLPSDYDVNDSKRYPVIYYFHGWGGRYKWDNYQLEDDPGYPGNGRREPPFVMEWRNYSQSNDIIIVTWDGYEPNLHPGKFYREGIDYGGCNPYDFPRAHEDPIVHWGWDFRIHFRDLVAHIDRNYRTIADRDHRGVTGLSMGGLTAMYISGQNKDLVGSVSAFCPAANLPRYGPMGHLSVFPVNEMYRSLKGLPMRLTATNGDWLLANDLRMKRIFEGSGFEPFEFHMADFPDHWSADTDLQLDYHMDQFGKGYERPVDWNHICPSFKTFGQWGYEFRVERSIPALTILENVSSNHMKVMSREFIPDGPVVLDETIHVTTDSLYTSLSTYGLLIYNLSEDEFSTKKLNASPEGRLTFSLSGGGNIVGIHGEDRGPAPDLRVVDILNRDYIYFDTGRDHFLDFRLVNIGNSDARQIIVRAFSSHPHINITVDEIKIPGLESGESVLMAQAFKFSFDGYEKDNLAGNIRLEINIDGVITDTQKIVFMATPGSPYADDDAVIVLDGRTVSKVRVFSQKNNEVEKIDLSGGYGNGNGIPERGEEVLVYIRLDQGLAPRDKNTFHKTHLVGEGNDPHVSVNRLKYEIKTGQASATSVLSYVSISDDMPSGHEPDLWFRVESLYNDREKEVARRPTYEFHYDYRRVKF
ncbi:MAG: alpha/beta hydrolase-fold protein [Bacteroidales bacterium]